MARAIVRGGPKVYVSKPESGEDAKRAFCPECGTPLWSVPLVRRSRRSSWAHWMTIRTLSLDCIYSSHRRLPGIACMKGFRSFQRCRLRRRHNRDARPRVRLLAQR
ncbi:GFA family protein [Bradyrhizobium sp. 25ACV]